MSLRKKTSDLPNQPHVVGTIPTAGALAVALKLPPGAVDFLEVRVDHFVQDLGMLRKALPKLKIPLIVTVRHPLEGGMNGLRKAERQKLYEEFLPFASLIDVELRSATALAETLQTAQKAGVKVILSAHDFRRTPPFALLKGLPKKARAAGADIFKIATQANSVKDVQTLLQLLTPRAPLPLSVMGMGPQGKIARLVLAAGGSVLNYGYLDQVQVAGQWPARLLKERLAELR